MSEPTDQWDDLFASLPADTKVEESHQQDLEQRVLGAYDAASTGQELPTPQKREPTLRRSTLLKLAMAASVLFGLALVFSIGSRPAFALEELVDKIVNATTARWDMVLQQNGAEYHRVAVSLTPNGYRLDSDLQIMIVNWDTGKGLGLFPQTKEAVIDSAPKRSSQIDEFLKIRDRLQQAMLDPDQNVESLGERTFGKESLMGFRFLSGGQSVDVWADPRTGFPERIEVSIGKAGKGIFLNYETEWEADETLLSTEIPEGYRLIPGEDDLIASLRISCDLFDGVFPPDLSTQGIGEVSARFLTEQTELDGMTEEQRNEIVKELLDFQRGFAFLIALSTDTRSDVHYAGNGVRLNDADRPILWYKPKDAETYRVIDASFEVSEQPNAPEVPGATKL